MRYCKYEDLLPQKFVKYIISIFKFFENSLSYYFIEKFLKKRIQNLYFKVTVCALIYSIKQRDAKR